MIKLNPSTRTFQVVVTTPGLQDAQQATQSYNGELK
jgi:hypothetical protein